MALVKVCRCGASFCVVAGAFEDHRDPFTDRPCEGSGKRPRKADGNGHGGLRPGAGRPRRTAPAPKRTFLHVELPAADLATVKARAGERGQTVTEAVRAALRGAGLLD